MMPEKVVGSYNEGGFAAQNYNQGKNEGQMSRGRPRMMLMNWKMKEGYSGVGARARQREEWQHWKYKLALKDREPQNS